MEVRTETVSIPIPVALEPEWTEPCLGVVLSEPPKTNEQLIHLAEQLEAVRRDCDDRMAKIREIQPGSEQ